MPTADFVAYADRISDRVIDMLNEARLEPDFSPLAAMAGIMLALFGSFMESAPPLGQPVEFKEARAAIGRCLDSIFREMKDAQR